MNKENYLKVRAELVSGNLTNESIELMRGFWDKHKPEDYKNLEEIEFRENFVRWLQYPTASLNLGKIIDYYDDVFTVVEVKDKHNNLLTLF